MPRSARDRTELKTIVTESGIRVFKKLGVRFTMDDVAADSHMSKKTIYRAFRDKDELCAAMADYLFDGVKEAERMVLESDLPTVEKLRTLLGALPESYNELDFTQLHLLKDKYPELYKIVEKRLETGWETTIALIDRGIEEGVIRPIPVPLIKLMFESSIEKFFQKDVLLMNGIGYTEALEQVVSVIMDGIAVHPGENE